jgi:hypothetical protein
MKKKQFSVWLVLTLFSLLGPAMFTGCTVGGADDSNNGGSDGNDQNNGTISTYTFQAVVSVDTTPASAAGSALDSEGHTHVVWIKRSQTDTFDTVMYTLFDGTTHTNTIVDGAGNNDKSASVFISLDSNDTPHIVWFSKREENEGTDSGNYGVYYASDPDGNGSFNIEQVSTNPADPTDNTDNIFNCYVAGRPKVSFNNGTPLVSYISDSNALNSYKKYLIFARKNGTSWSRTQEFLPSANFSVDEGFYLPADLSNGMYAGWIDISDYNPRYYYYSSSWEDVISSGYDDIYGVEHLQLASDNFGNVHAMWSNDNKNHFYHTVLNGTSYGTVTETELQGSMASNFGPAAVDPADGTFSYVYDKTDSNSLFLVTATDTATPIETELTDIGNTPSLKTFHVRNGTFSLLSITEGEGISITTGPVE